MAPISGVAMENPATIRSLMPKRVRRAGNEQLLAEISAYCQRAGMAESTFGRRVVNDGKLVTRLRFGGRVTTHTVDRVRSYIARGSADQVDVPGDAVDSATLPAIVAPRSVGFSEATHFRFYDNRQKYLLFVHTCNEKRVVA